MAKTAGCEPADEGPNPSLLTNFCSRGGKADTLRLERSARKGMKVQILPGAPELPSSTG